MRESYLQLIEAPEYILDDLGIHHMVEIPHVAKYTKEPCKCGIIHKWENPETFQIYEMQMTDPPSFPLGKFKQCKSCLEILKLKKYEDQWYHNIKGKMFIFGTGSLEKKEKE